METNQNVPDKPESDGLVGPLPYVETKLVFFVIFISSKKTID